MRALALFMVVLLAASADATPAAPERPLVFVPGLLGSRLCIDEADDPEEPIVLWGTLTAIRRFPSLLIEGEQSQVRACGLIREISFLGLYSQELYAPFLDRLQAEAYREGETLFLFDYDWRMSVFDNAERFAAYIERTFPDPSVEFDIVAHSMGGLIAKVYALDFGGVERIRTFVTAGTPWHGSAKIVEALESGWGSASLVVGGLAGFRRTLASFPSTFELMPRYDGCCGEGQRAFRAGDPGAWTAIGLEGFEAQYLPDPTKASARLKELRRIAKTPLPSSVDEVSLVALDHRTPAHFQFSMDTVPKFGITRSWAGDGVVLRDSATAEEGTIFATSFAGHSDILGEPEVQDFLVLALEEGPDVARRTIQPRERTKVFTQLREVVELIGVAIEIDRPAYRPGEIARVTVHLRPDSAEPYDPALLRMEVTRPAETAGAFVPLVADPAASDPAIPLEQSFSAQVEIGATSGYLRIEVELDGADGAPRTEVRSIPIVEF